MMRRHIADNLIKIISAILVISLCAGCAATGSAESDTSEATASESVAETADTDASADDVELIEPAGTVLKYETAQFRELANVSVYQGVVCPDTEEYAYESDQPFGNFSRLPGDTVASGDMLFYGAVEGIDDSIEEVEETNAALLESHNDKVSDYIYDLAKARKNEFEAASAYQDMVANAPDEDSPWYAGWAKGVMPIENNAKQAKMAREKLEQAYMQDTELFDLEYAYNEKRILRMEDKKNDAGVYSAKDGVVVACNYYMAGDYVPLGSEVIAVGDPSRKEIVCEYVSKSIVNKSVEIYAIINGKKYDVVYENMEPEEYRRLKQQNDEVYTTFQIAGDTQDVPLGQYAVIVVVESSIKNALCVPKGAVSKDDSGFFVYLYDNGDSVYTPVTTGKSDSGFTEILSGLSEGDKVVYDASYDLGSSTKTITRGGVHNEFSADGYLMYPSAEWMCAPKANGVCYLNEICVEQFEQVEEGQTLAKVEIVSDTVGIDRIKRKIQRENERIADLNAEKKTTYDQDSLDMLDRAIRDRNRSIESLNKQLEKADQYSGVVEIKAPYSGIIIEMSSFKAGEIINAKEKLVRLAADDSCYVIVEDKGGVLSYGDKAVVTSKDSNGKATEAEGTIVSLNPYGLSKSMKTGYALVRVSPEDMALLTGRGSENSNGYWYRIRLSIKATTRSMENVLLVPKNSIYKVGNDTYVVIKDEDGSSRLVRFVAGGSDNANYWVAYGDITEGMTICSG